MASPSDKQSKWKFLVEMFETVSPQKITALLDEHGGKDMRFLVDRCLELTPNEEAGSGADDDQVYGMISILAASQNSNNADSSNSSNNQNNSNNSSNSNAYENKYDDNDVDIEMNGSRSSHASHASQDCAASSGRELMSLFGKRQVPSDLQPWFESELVLFNAAHAGSNPSHASNASDASNPLSNGSFAHVCDVHDQLAIMYEQHLFATSSSSSSSATTMVANDAKYDHLRRFLRCVEVVSKMLENIVSNPKNEKFRSIGTHTNTYKNKIAPIGGSPILLRYCGFDFVPDTDANGANGSKNDAKGLYMFNSDFSLRLVGLIRSFLEFYVLKFKETKLGANGSNSSSPNRSGTARTGSGTDVSVRDMMAHRKKQKFDSARLVQNERRRNQGPKAPKMNKLSPDELRKQRLRRLGDLTEKDHSVVDANYRGVGPVPDRIMDLSQPNLQKELRQIGHKKHQKWRNTKLARKRVFTMADLENLQKEDFDRKARGPVNNKNEMDLIGKKALELTNKFRKENGLAPLQWHQSLCDIGKEHSVNMGDGKVAFGHDGFNDRVKKYPFRPMSAAENVAMSSGIAQENVASVAVNGWIDSPGHRKNMLANHNWCGIGVCRNSKGAYYLTQLFGLTR